MNKSIKYTLILSLWGLAALIFYCAFTYGWFEVWHILRVPSQSTPFLDLTPMVIAEEAIAKGVSPINYWPGFPYNHPPLLAYIFYTLHIGYRDLIYVGGAEVTGLLICLSLLIMQSKSTLEALLLFFSAFSAAALLAMERGTSDMLIFILVVLAVLGGRFRFAGLMSLAALLKLFPVFGLCAGIFSEGFRKITLLAVGLVSAYFLYHFSDLVKIKHIVSISGYMSYGMVSIRAFLHNQAWYTALCILLVPYMATAVILAMKDTAYEQALIADFEFRMFLAFGLIYAGTFLLGSNWNYRLIFLIPVIPLLSRLFHYRKDAMPMLGLIYLNLAIHARVFGGWWGDRIGMAAEVGMVYIVIYFTVISLKNSGIKFLY